jgi:hypothetical protein
MNSTSQELTRRFFFQELMPAAAELKQKRGTIFASEPAPQASSYFVKREKTGVDREDFEISDADLRRACYPGTPFAALLAPGLAELRQSLYQPEEQDHEVSPFIYIMF